MSNARHPDHPIATLFTERWSPRAFTGEPLPQATLDSFFEAARWAPSGFNAQPWRFIYAHRETADWAPIFDSLIPFNQGWAAQASALVVVLSRTAWVPPGKTEAQPHGSHAFDAGAAWQNLALQASLSGWAAHGIGGFDGKRLRGALGIPADHAIQAVVAIGRRGDKASLPEALQAREAPNERLPITQLVAQGRFDFQGA